MSKDRLHLRPIDRQCLLSLINQHLPDIEVWAYGSRVKGRSHEGSDLDLVLRKQNLTNIEPDRLAAFKEARQESAIPFLVEAKDWATLPASFLAEIEKDYEVLITQTQA